MKLIHRMDLELLSSADSRRGKPRTMAVSASFYRPYLDGGYKHMIVEMMLSGCFDGLVEKAIVLAVDKGMFNRTFLF